MTGCGPCSTSAWLQGLRPGRTGRSGAGGAQASLDHLGNQVSTVAATRSTCQVQGSSRSSSCALIRPETMRSSTSVSHAWGSTPLSFAVATKLATIAQLRALASEPANTSPAHRAAEDREPQRHGGSRASVPRPSRGAKKGYPTSGPRGPQECWLLWALSTCQQRRSDTVGEVR